MTPAPAETVKLARQAVEQSRSGHYLSGFHSSTRLLEDAYQELLSLSAATRLEELGATQKQQMQEELLLLGHELSRSEAIHRQAGSLTAEWARVFTEATRSEPASGYSRDGLPELVSTHITGSLEWEA